MLEVGEGPPLLFVHGAGMTVAVWAPLLAHLPGCGLTAPFDYRGVDLREHARAFLSLLVRSRSETERGPIPLRAVAECGASRVHSGVPRNTSW